MYLVCCLLINCEICEKLSFFAESTFGSKHLLNGSELEAQERKVQREIKVDVRKIQFNFTVMHNNFNLMMQQFPVMKHKELHAHKSFIHVSFTMQYFLVMNGKKMNCGSRSDSCMTCASSRWNNEGELGGASLSFNEVFGLSPSIYYCTRLKAP